MFLAKKYIAFISYRHAELDSAIAKKLHSLIEQYRIPRGLQNGGEKRLGVVFRDEEELHAASDLSSEIQNALNDTEYLIVICSKNSVQSPWVTREIDHFLQNHDRSHVLTVLASGEPSEVFPVQLTQSPDGPDAPPIEPLAVDVRADTISGSCKKLRREIPRLIAAILECPYDALVMREQKRKNRRITSVAAGIMAIMLSFTSMVLVKNQQIALANTQLETKNTELNQANTALAEQKAAVQLRESQLLAQDAEADLENADYRSAIEKALSALPQSQSDPRPYHAPAERALMEAANVFQPAAGSEELNTLQLEQLTDVADFVITQDGSRVVSVDNFGTACCFDAATGRQLWSQHAAPDNGSSTMSNLHLFLCCNDTAVIRSTRRQLTAYDLQTGKQLWVQNVGDIAKGYIFYRPDRDVLLLVTTYNLDYFNIAYQLTEVCAQTGEILQTIPIFTQDGNLLGSFANTHTVALSKAGIFSPDGTQFYGVFFDMAYQLHAFHADLIQGTAQVLSSYDGTYGYASKIIGMSMQESSIQVIIQDVSSDILVSVLSFQADTGKPEWQTDVAPSSETFSLVASPGCTLFTPSDILIGSYDHYIHLDRKTGKHLYTILSPDNILDMAPVSDYTFGITLASGTYLLGWLQTDNTLMLSNDSFLNMDASLVTPAVSKVWGGGILQLYADNDVFQLGIGNLVSPGYVTIIPKGKENTIQIIRPKQAPSLVPYTPVTLPDENVSASSGCAATPVGSHLVTGPFSSKDNTLRYYYMIDPLTLKVADSFSTKEVYYERELFWLPDTLQPLICDYSGEIYLINTDGSQTQLYDPEAEQKKLAEEEELLTSLSLFRNTSGYVDNSKTLLTAACTPKALQIWKNGIPTTQTPLPEQLQIPAQDRITKDLMLKVGTNGWILAGFYEYGSPIPLDSIAAYDSAHDNWTVLEGDPVFYNANSIALAQEKEWLACVDQDGMLKILDLQTGYVRTQFPTQIPFGSVLQMQFFQDDTCLAVKTAGGYLRIYELEYGTQLYYDQFKDAYSSVLQIYEDPRNQRLYLQGGSGSGICLDLRSWTVLGYPDDLLYYSTDADLLYVTAPISSGAALWTGRIPGTLELVRIGSEFLAYENQ